MDINLTGKVAIVAGGPGAWPGAGKKAYKPT